MEACNMKPEAGLKGTNLNDLKAVKTMCLLFVGRDMYNHDFEKPEVVFDDTMGIAQLVLNGFASEIGRDDAYIYYRQTIEGKRLVLDVDIALRKAAGLDPNISSIAHIKHTFANDAPKTFDETMTLAQYRDAGVAVASKVLDADAFDGVNELHWDEHHAEQTPLFESVEMLIKSAPGLRRNSPRQLSIRHELISKIRDNILDECGGLNKMRQAEELRNEVFNAMGIRLGTVQSEHFVTDKVTNNLNMSFIQEAQPTSTADETSQHREPTEPAIPPRLRR
jgi:hypothetical protein